MKVAIHQPNYAPWLGYFRKMALADVFIYLDSVQFTKNSFQNRVKIDSPNGSMWLTIPIKHEFHQLTRDVLIETNINWRNKHLKTLTANYKRANHYDEIFPIISKIYHSTDTMNLSEFCISLTDEIRTSLKLKTRVLRASGLNAQGSSTELLIGLIKEIGGEHYLSGGGGRKYQDEALYKQGGIQLEYVDYIHPRYPQVWKNEFQEGLSIIDALMNLGIERTREMILLEGL